MSTLLSVSTFITQRSKVLMRIAVCPSVCQVYFVTPQKYALEVYLTSCSSYKWTNTLWKPSCNDDDSWSAKQCKGEISNGKCFCYNPKGTRIFGWTWWKNSKNMTCACSRRRDELKGIRDDVSLHCSENGNYEELQCDNGLCWCVETKTGKPTQRIYPESVMTYLPCYKKKHVGLQYLRQCESKHIAKSQMLMKLKTHGMEFLHLDDVFCDGDGSYGFYKLVKKQAQCTWKDSKQLELYQGPVSGILSMNCHCARDTRILNDEGIEMILTCQSNGNYDVSQIDNGRPFCVDDDGFPTTSLGDFGQIIKCPPTIIEIE
ncbi:hypothetical protein PV326_002402 [Microctonus aethiopoides]|nr:hypothetical protein PV326_002402 [Microctonus aethiopoides]